MRVYVVRAWSTDGKNTAYDFCFDADKYTLEQVKSFIQLNSDRTRKSDAEHYQSFEYNGNIYRKPDKIRLYDDYEAYCCNDTFLPWERERRIVLVNE